MPSVTLLSGVDMDKKKIEKAIIELIKAVGENPNREELKKTPARFASLMEELLSGTGKNPKEILQITHDLKHDEMVLAKGMPFYSMREHHLMPFFGKCHVAYIPDKNRIVGISRLVDIVNIMSRRLQVQERLTTDIANSIMRYLKPKGVGVVIEARHLCMEMRNLREAVIVTSAVRGLFRKDIKTREEFLKLIK